MMGISWVELSMLMTIGMFLVVVFIIVHSVINKRPAAGEAAPWQAPRPAAPQVHLSAAARPRLWDVALLVVVLLIVVLALVAPLGWLLFGQAGMPMVRMTTIGLLLVVLLAVIVGGIAVVTQFSRSYVSQGHASQGHAPQGQSPLNGHDPATHVDLVARITQRFCPRCRAALAADAPEGLCPACLMAAAFTSDAGQAALDGLAATTPPGELQRRTAAEWSDLERHFPQLEVLELIGRGGMGAVYRARQKHLDRIVALKVIPPEAAKDPTFAERFAREARALARLNHPNIVTVYDFGQAGDVYYLLMEYVAGVNLRHAQAASRLAPSEALAIVPQICDALQYAHDQGVVHRDIKPENILLDRSGRVKIADFGLAKMLGKGPDDFTLTQAQQVMGTPRYMAPEQIEKPLTVDHRADIYSLGVVLYEMLTGELPLGRFVPPSHKVQLDVRIDEVVLRALEKEPERRFQRASQVKSELASASGSNAPVNQSFASRPVWQTPAPASKSESSQDPGGVPLKLVLAAAMGMVLGGLMMAGGLATGIYAMTTMSLFDGPTWGWMGAAFGCLMGGFGSAAGSYNTYRQLGGQVDLMRAAGTTWFDWSMSGFLMVGVVLLAAGGVATFVEGKYKQIGYGSLLLGGILAFQSALFLVWRMLLRPNHPHPSHPRAGLWLIAVLALILFTVLILIGLSVGIYWMRQAAPGM
jgi:predicted Ser/Thr protein kinase